MNDVTDQTPIDVEAHLERYEREVREELTACAVNDPEWVQRAVNALTLRERRKISLMRTRRITALEADELLVREGYILPLRPSDRGIPTRGAFVSPWRPSRTKGSRAARPDRADKDLAQIQRRFRAVRRRADWPARWRRIVRRSRAWLPVLLLVVVGAFTGYALLASQPWPAWTSLRHFAAFPNCAMARVVGLAPAARGQPGYWPQHDADFDGWACEPMPRR